MAYIIKRYGSDLIVSSGQTRMQVLSALRANGLIDWNSDDKEFPALPRFKKTLLISVPLCDPRGSFTIEHV